MTNKRKQAREIVAFTDQDEMNFINGDVKLVHDLLHYAQALFSETFNREGTLKEFLNNTRVIEQFLRNDKSFYPYFINNNEVNSNSHNDTKVSAKPVNNTDLNADEFLDEIIANDDSVH